MKDFLLLQLLFNVWHIHMAALSAMRMKQRALNINMGYEQLLHIFYLTDWVKVMTSGCLKTSLWLMLKCIHSLPSWKRFLQFALFLGKIKRGKLTRQEFSLLAL